MGCGSSESAGPSKSGSAPETGPRFGEPGPTPAGLAGTSRCRIERRAAVPPELRRERLLQGPIKGMEVTYMNTNRLRPAPVAASARRLRLGVGRVIAVATVLSVVMVATASARMRDDTGRGRRVVPGGYGRTVRWERSAPVHLDSKRVLDVRTWRLRLPVARASR